MATSRELIDTRVGSWLEGTGMRIYAVSPSPVPASEASNWPVARSDLHTAGGNVSPGPLEYWKKSTIASNTQDAPSNPETSSHLDNRTLVQIVGQHAEQVAQSRPTPDSIYFGPEPSIRFGYRPDRDSATGFVVTGSGYGRLYRWNLHAEDFVNLPEGTARPLSLIDKKSVAAAVVHSHFGSKGYFHQPNMQRLNQGLLESLNKFYRERRDLSHEYIFTTEIDANTHERVLVALSKYYDAEGTQFTAAIRFGHRPSAT